MSELRVAVSSQEATAELEAVLASAPFTRSPRLSRLLAYLCTKYLAGESDQIKEYSIGVEVLQRPPSFDPATDASARVEVHRLRRRLQQFYETEGTVRSLRIVIPVGHYVPAFLPNHGAPANGAPPETPAEAGPNVSFNLVAGIETSEPAPGLHKTMPLRAVIGVAVFVLLATALLALKFWGKTARATAAPARTTAAAAVPTSNSRPAVVVQMPGNSLRFACGRPVPYTDREGQIWAADRYFDGGSVVDSPRQFLSRAFDPKLFQRGRSGDFTYHIPLPKGVYELRLGFAETTYGPSTPAGGGEYSRTFDVRANGRLVLDDFDIYSDAGGTNIADTRVFKDISAGPDGLLHLEFRSRRGAALVNTIQLMPAQPHRLNPIRLVAQENFLTLANGVVWSPDTYVGNGVLAAHAIQVTGTEDPDLFGRERYGHFDYAIPVDNGAYSLSLYFAEEYFGPGNPGAGGPGSRLFDVFCNGAALLRNFDILKEGGPNRALVKTFHNLTPNAQGKLSVSFVPVHNYASLYAIEVLDESQ